VDGILYTTNHLQHGSYNVLAVTTRNQGCQRSQAEESTVTALNSNDDSLFENEPRRPN
jgi:hypothetical protein